jgi:hypothetical protein
MTALTTVFATMDNAYSSVGNDKNLITREEAVALINAKAGDAVAPVISSATIDASGYVLLSVTDASNDRWQVYQDGVTLGGVLTVKPDNLSVVQLSIGSTSVFYIRGWKSSNAALYADSATVTLTRQSANVGYALRHDFFEADAQPVTGQTFTVARNQVTWKADGAGWDQIAANAPVWIGADQYYNVFPNSGAPATQSFTLQAGQYVVAVTGTGTLNVTSTGQLAAISVTEAGGAKIFDTRPANADSETVTCTVTGTLSTVLMYRGTDTTNIKPYIASSAGMSVSIVGGARARILHMPAQSAALSSYGMKPTTSFDGLSTFNRTGSTEFGPDGSAMYKLICTNTAAVQHGATSPRNSQTAGTYFLDIWVSDSSQHANAFGIGESGGGKTLMIVNPSTGAINASSVTSGSPTITGWSVQSLGTEGDSWHYRIKFTNPSTQTLTVLTYTGANLTDSTYASLTYTGNNTKSSYLWGGFLSKNFPVHAPAMLNQTNPCPADVHTYTGLTTAVWSTTATSIRWRGRVRTDGEALTYRYIVGWTNGGVRVRTDNKVEIVMASTVVLTTSWAVDPGKDLSIHARLQSGSFAIAVDNRAVETSSTTAALPTVTTLYLGSDGAGANQLCGSTDTLEVDPSGATNAILPVWTIAQGTNGTIGGTAPPTTVNKWRKAYNGMWVRYAGMLSGVTGAEAYAFLATVKGWNSNNGFANIKGINLFWPLKNIRPGVSTYTWTDLDNMLDRLDSYGVKCIVHIIETEFNQTVSDLGSSYAFNDRYRSNFFPSYMLVWNRHYHSYMAAYTPSDQYYNREEVRMEDWDNSLKYVYEAYVQICARYRQHPAFMGICGTETTKLGLRDTTTPAGTASGYVRKGLEMDNLRRMRGQLSALYPDLVIGAFQSFSRDGATSTASMIQHLNGLGNGYEGWPDSRVTWLQEDPAVQAYWYEAADYNPGKLADTCLLFPGSQEGIIQYTLSEYQSIWSLAKARFNCHGMISDFKSGGGKSTQQYYEQVTLVMAPTINSQCNQTNPFGAG